MMVGEPKLDELEAENRTLRTAAVSLAATLLREAAVDLFARQPLQRFTAERLMREADECFRSARIPELKAPMAEGLECAGRELMAKAVEIETDIQRGQRVNNSPAQPPRE